jgi:alpha-tubulin suppressor-like RCC1 family protein
MISRTRSDRLHRKFHMQSGFALPTLLVSAIIMLIVLLSAGTAATTLRTSLDEQHYNALAREAAESGHARAEACLMASGYTATWSDSTRLRPDTNCNGITFSGGQKYITQTDNMRTTFVVWAPVIGTSSSAKVTVVGTTELFRTSTQSTYQVYSQTIVRQSKYAAAPKMAGGAGWKGSGHLAAVLTSDRKLYGFGSNVGGQLNDSSTPSIVPTPAPIDLPGGVAYVSDVVTSGQGASIICIIANTGDAWCRGVPGAAENGLMPLLSGWKKFTLPTGLTAVSMSISGYGPDTMCVLASDSQAYCAGENYYGSLGTNDLTYSISKLDSVTPQKFRLDIPAPGALLRKIYTMGDITCGITTTNDMYCAGLNWTGQIAGPSVNGTGNGVYATPIRYPIPGARKVDDVSVTYHMSDGHPLLHALATDGTIWSSGNYQFGDAGNGLTTGNTGTSQAPTLFTHTDKAYATGSELWNAQSNKCIDNNAGGSANGNIIHLWDCSPTAGHPNQTWVYGKNKQITNLGTGKCLDVPGGNLSAGVKLQLWDCNNSLAQQFELVGTNTIKPTGNSALCFDATGNGTANGTLIELWDCYGNGAQSFTRWPGINGWRGMVVGVNHFCGIRDDSWSGMWCAGNNSYGQLANWATSSANFMGQCVSAPNSGHNFFNVNFPSGDKVDYAKLTDEWTRQYNSTLVITVSGKVYGAGRNEFGKLGNGTLGDPANDFRECAVKQFILPAGVTAVDMSTRDEFTTYVLGSDGRIYAAGRNNLGQVGDGTTADRLTPVEVKIPRQATVY